MNDDEVAGPASLHELKARLLAGAAPEELLALVEALQEAGQTFGQLEAWLYALVDRDLPAEALARLEGFLDADFGCATELSAGGGRYWTFLHHRHDHDLGFGEAVSLKAIGRPGYGLFLFCRPGDYPELEPRRVDDHHVFLGVEGQLPPEEELAALVERYVLVPLLEETGGRQLIDRLTGMLGGAPRTAFSVSKTSSSPDVWQLSVARGRSAEVLQAAEELRRRGIGGSLSRLQASLR
jgi:hypothetical protein